MKKLILAVCLSTAFASSAWGQTQSWSDTPQFIDGQPSAQSQAVSPALMSPANIPNSAMANNPAQLQYIQNQQRQIQAQQALLASQSQSSTQDSESGEANSTTQEQQTAEDKPPMEDTEAKRLMWAVDPSQNLRQEGGRLEKPLSRGFASSAAPADRLRLAEWKRHLLNVGIPQNKIEFEARRLDREDFELWASRLVWWENGEHPNMIDVSP